MLNLPSVSKTLLIFIKAVAFDIKLYALFFFIFVNIGMNEKVFFSSFMEKRGWREMEREFHSFIWESNFVPGFYLKGILFKIMSSPEQASQTEIK